MFLLTIKSIGGSTYTGEGKTILETIKSLPDEVLDDVYREVDERIMRKHKEFNDYDFPFEGELEVKYNSLVDKYLVESFDFKMDINNFYIVWTED